MLKGFWIVYDNDFDDLYDYLKEKLYYFNSYKADIQAHLGKYAGYFAGGHV